MPQWGLEIKHMNTTRTENGRHPLVGITCGRSVKRNSPTRCHTNEAYVQAILDTGGLPVLLPAVDPALAGAYLDRVDGLLLPGGIDIEPTRYSAQPHPMLGETDGVRDAFELAITLAAWERRMPLLAICRGLQVLNVALGGSLIQDLPSERPSSIAHRQTEPRPEGTHEVAIEPGSMLARLIGDRCIVNSFHHQALDRVADDLIVTAAAPDGVIEAVESGSRPGILAVQWHPEEMQSTDAAARSLFVHFVGQLRS